MAPLLGAAITRGVILQCLIIANNGLPDTSSDNPFCLNCLYEFYTFSSVRQRRRSRWYGRGCLLQNHRHPSQRGHWLGAPCAVPAAWSVHRKGLPSCCPGRAHGHRGYYEQEEKRGRSPAFRYLNFSITPRNAITRFWYKSSSNFPLT